MNHLYRGVLIVTGLLGLAMALLVAPASRAQNSPKESPSSNSAKTEQWIHVRVENKDDKNEIVRVNVPIDMAVKVLPAINKNQLHNGKITLDNAHMNDVDLRTLLDAVRSAKDGEYVTVQGHGDNVRVAKNNGYLYIHVSENSSHHKAAAKDKEGKDLANAGMESKVEIKVPMKVVDALFSAGDHELDLVAALRALSAHGDTELVSVKDAESTVHVWIDSKNISD